jgi:hypothetical protein
VVFVEMAKAWAGRIIAEMPEAPEQERLIRMFREGFSRQPNQDEMKVLENLADAERKSGRSEAEVWTTVARLLMNTDEFITRE